MIVDTSAVMAVLKQEPEAAALAAAMAGSGRPAMSAATWLEAAIVADSPGDAVVSLAFDHLVKGFEIVPVTAGQAARARLAYRAWGRGRHPARLNFGGCFAYALAQERGEPLLFKGGDFAQTDITPALPARP
jgi:ribonuclease VapC